MRRMSFYFIVLLLFPGSFASFAQSNDLNFSLILLKEERSKFLKGLKSSQLDPNIVRRITRFGESEVDYIQQFILSAPIGDQEKEKAIRSLFSFVKGLSDYVSQPKVAMYDIPVVIESYQVMLKRLINKRSIEHQLTSLDPWASQLLAESFRQYKEYQLIEDITTYKRVASSPEYILPFIENKPGFQFNDSLVITLAAHDPLKLANNILKNKPGLQRNIRNSNSIYLKQIISLAGDRDAPELMPFLVQLAEQRISAVEVMKQRTDIKKYYQLLVNTLINELGNSGTSSFTFHQALRIGLKEKSLAFYVNQINELHDATDAVRFVSVKGLRPEDLYYIITSSEEEMYTSSYLGLYRRLMEYFKTSPADSIFQLVRYDNFRTFMRIAANYNTLTDFLNRMPHENAAALVKRFVSGIEDDTNAGLEKAMDIADSFIGLDSAFAISELMESELHVNLERCKSGQLYFGVRLYNILTDVFNLVKQKGSANKQLLSEIGNYDVLERRSLLNRNKEIVQLVLFYGDEDGNSSFNNFLSLYKDTTKWQVTKNESWVTIRSVSDEPVVIYANLPLDYKKELDIQAQDALFNYLKQESIEPVVLVHRGHSYHLNKTLAKMKRSVKLAILGSCGGYNKIISVATISPDAHIIVTKKTGSKFINDPMIEVINDKLVNKMDLRWTDVWQSLSGRFSKDQFTLNLFNEYIPPARNVGLFVLKLFNSYKRFA